MTSFFLAGRLGSVLNRFHHTSWVAVVTLTDRPKSVHTRCVIEVFVGVFVLPLYVSEFSVGMEAFIIELSQISSFFSFRQTLNLICSEFGWKATNIY